jgi:hypothetical protein
VIFRLEDGTGVIECWSFLRGNGGGEASLGFALGELVAASGVLFLHNKCVSAPLLL